MGRPAAGDKGRRGRLECAIRRGGGESGLAEAWNKVMTERPLTLVTGAGRGIGRAIAFALAQAGHDLVLVAVSDRLALEATGDTARSYGAACELQLCDVSEEAA